MRVTDILNRLKVIVGILDNNLSTCTILKIMVVNGRVHFASEAHSLEARVDKN